MFSMFSKMSEINCILEKIKVLNKLNEKIKRNIKLLHVSKSYKEIYVILVTNEDKVYCCGSNKYEVLGFGHHNYVEESTINEELSNKRIIDLKSSSCYTIARDSDGKLYCWGRNRYLWNGREDEEITKPKLNKYLINKNITDMCCGSQHILVLTSNNEVYSWGENYSGQIGNRSDDEDEFMSKPYKVNEINEEKVEEISCGSFHSMVLTESGCVYSWGHNDFGQLGLSNGKKRENKPERIEIEVKIKKISCGEHHSLLLSCEGDIFVFGSNKYKQLGLKTNEEKQLTPIKLKHSEKFIDIASHYYYNISAALSENGLYYVWGDCGNYKSISEPIVTQFKSFNEIFVHYFGITYKTLKISHQNMSQIEKKEIESNENETQVFTLKEVIGTGSFGKVYKVFHQIEQQFYAMKEIHLKGFSEEMKAKSSNEIQIMSKLRSDHVIHCTTSWIDNNSILYIVMELCYSTLREVIKQKQQRQLVFNRKQLETMSSIEYYISSELFKEILKGVNYLHKFNPPIIHRDLKPTNILITFGTNGKFVKIADFGLATYHKFDEESHTEWLGTVKYIAPEVLGGRSYDWKSDIYSLGVIAQELFDIDINASTNTPFNNLLIKDKFKIISNYIPEMMDLKTTTRPDCQNILNNKSLWYLDLNAIKRDFTPHKFNELSINEQSIEKCFYKFFIKTKLMQRSNDCKGSSLKTLNEIKENEITNNELFPLVGQIRFEGSFIETLSEIKENEISHENNEQFPLDSRYRFKTSRFKTFKSNYLNNSLGVRLLKYLLYFFNLLWLALGGSNLYFGFKLNSLSGDLDEVMDSNMKNGAIVILAAAFVIFLIAFLGCCGAIKENSCMLSVYCAIILILIIIQCIGSYLAFKYRTEIKGEISKGINKEFEKFENDMEAQEAVNKFQNSFECCGSDSYSDWDRILPVDKRYPGSCCKGKDYEDGETCKPEEIVIDQFKGCIHTVTNTVEKALGGLGGIAIGLVLIQLLIIVSAYRLKREVH